jgi:hypothetical protein
MTLQPTTLGRKRTVDDGCRRYRVSAVDFDTRARMLNWKIGDDWEDHVREMWLENKRHIREGILVQYGIEDSERKLADFAELDAGPWSVVALHNRLMRAVRTAFIAGAYYPALVGAAGLGERILNQIILELRAEFSDNPATPRVMNKKSLDDWKLMIATLEAWGVLPSDVAEKFERLRRLRNDAVHYNRPELDHASRDEALEAVILIQQIIERVFYPDSTQLIEGIDGVQFLTLDAEKEPFAQRFFIPASALVSPTHQWAESDPVTILDDPEYQDPEGLSALTDTQFAARFKAQTTAAAAARGAAS